MTDKTNDLYAAFTDVINRSDDREFFAVDAATGVRGLYRVAEHVNIGKGWLLFSSDGRIFSHAELRDPEVDAIQTPIVDNNIEKGDRYRLNAINWSLISARSLPPHWRYLTVVWNDGENVHYRFDGEDLVKQTSVDRWLGIMGRSFHKGVNDLQRV